MEFYVDISWESRLNIEINVWAQMSQMDAWKKLKLPKVGKGCLKLSFFYGSHIDGNTNIL